LGWIYLAGLGASPGWIGLDWIYLAGLGASPGWIGYAEPGLAPRPARKPTHLLAWRLFSNRYGQPKDANQILSDLENRIFISWLIQNT